MTHEQKSLISPSSSKVCTVIRVDKDVDFVVDDDDITYLATVPSQKSLSSSRRTYSKKNPYTCNPCISFLEPVIENSYTVGKKRNTLCSPGSFTNKSGLKKRKLETDPIISKKLKKNNKLLNDKSCKSNGSIINNSKSRILKNDSSNSDVKIIEYRPGPSKIKLSSYDGKKVQNPKSKDKSVRTKLNEDFLKPNSSIKQSPQDALRPFFPTNDEKFINEADTAPSIVAGSIPDRPSSKATYDSVNKPQVKWLSHNEVIDVTPFSNENSKSSSTRDSQAHKYLKKCDQSSSQTNNDPPKKKKELELLYDQLNEISWTHETAFKKLLSTDLQKVENHATGRTLRSITGLKAKVVQSKTKSVQKGRNRAMGSNVKSGIQNKNLINNIKKRNLQRSSMVKQADKIKKRIYQDIKVKAQNVKEGRQVETLKTSKFGISKKTNSDFSKKNIKEKKKTNASNKSKVSKNLKKNDKGEKACDDVKITTDNNSKLPISTKDKFLQTKEVAKQNASSNSISSVRAIASGSGIKKNSSTKSKACITTKNKTIVKETINEVEQVGVNEIEFFSSLLGKNSAILTALQRGPSLRVALEPLEHTSHWNQTFYEEFKNQILEQALRQSLDNPDNENIKNMFQEIQEKYLSSMNSAKISKKKKSEEESIRSSVRQIEGSFRYKEIVVKKHKNYMQFVFVPNMGRKNCLCIEAMKELKEAFKLAKKDPSCKAVLINSSGPYFCTGIDLSQLITDHKKQLAEEMATTIRDLVLTIGNFPKPIVAAVNGITVGFGVSLLTLCDVVLASDKATFSIPATQLGYLPEGAITLTLPQVVGSSVASEMLLQGRRLTAEQALQHGLVSEVMWPTQLMNEVMPRLQMILSQPLEVMEFTKSMVRSHLWDKLKAHVEKECRFLPQLWLEAHCQNSIKKSLQTGWLIE